MKLRDVIISLVCLTPVFVRLMLPFDLLWINDLPNPNRLAVLDTATHSTIDFVNGINPNLLPVTRVEVAEHGYLYLQGWAVDAVARKASAGVYISIAGKSIPAVYGASRPDVAASHHVPDYLQSGFIAQIPAAEIPPGTHEASLRVVTHDRKACFTSSRIFLNVDRPLPPLHTLEALPDPILGGIDFINGVSVHSATAPLVVDSSLKTLTIRGWSADRCARDSAGAVSCVVDEVAYPAIPGLSRPDVAEAQSNPKYLLSGFECHVPLVGLKPGQHTLSLRVVTHDRTGYYHRQDAVPIHVADFGVQSALLLDKQ